MGAVRFVLLASLCTPACSSAPGEAEPAGGEEPPPADEIPAAGLHWEEEGLVFRTEPFTVDPGDERYLCFAVDTDEALKISRLTTTGNPVVHHFIFARTLMPEPSGWSECPTLLKLTWMPLFTAGAGANELALPAGVAHEIEAGSQLMVQLHLTNTTPEAVTGTTEIHMEVTDEPDTAAVELGGFGSFQITLPPHQQSTISHACTLPETSRIVALMPHMHQLGRSLTLELGTSADDLQRVYSRPDWDFDQQTIDGLDYTVDAGQYARVSCSYDNTTDRVVTYGESSFDEMCFLGVFWVGPPMNCVNF